MLASQTTTTTIGLLLFNSDGQQGAEQESSSAMQVWIILAIVVGCLSCLVLFIAFRRKQNKNSKSQAQPFADYSRGVVMRERSMSLRSVAASLGRRSRTASITSAGDGNIGMYSNHMMRPRLLSRSHPDYADTLGDNEAATVAASGDAGLPTLRFAADSVSDTAAGSYLECGGPEESTPSLNGVIEGGYVAATNTYAMIEENENADYSEATPANTSTAARADATYAYAIAEFPTDTATEADYTFTSLLNGSPTSVLQANGAGYNTLNLGSAHADTAGIAPYDTVVDESADVVYATPTDDESAVHGQNSSNAAPLAAYDMVVDDSADVVYDTPTVDGSTEYAPNDDGDDLSEARPDGAVPNATYISASST